ncbi:hypothetical protein BU23DRAFT_565669 [Bimuria novae-zelandiae CBS 107.79]|uniref:RING-type E3 ubiquitin transferase n=1 Tax=Bimuria novae-zelandiae CBS 107.79 TaxID=1447943 RepID=A0A6A5VH50_9PLEO|nr:hypothetical protein BU23DRAFT_565669 [Bimuria novae-zelandiae CBS 107.79]
MSESTTARPGAGQREMMFCHECHDEWYRDERGIICPECGSEFTEIIEADNDPRDNGTFEHEHFDDVDDDDNSMPSLEEADPHDLLHDHNHFRVANNEDPEEADISQMQFQNARMHNTGPNTYRITATMSHTIPINPLTFGQNGNGPTTIGGLTSFLTNLLQGGPQGPQRQAQGQGQAEAGDGQGGSAPRSGPDNGPHVHRQTFTYTPGARLHPRDGDNPGPRLEPVDDISNVLAGLFAAFGEPTPGGGGHGHPHGPHGPHDHEFGAMPMNPLMGLFAAMSGGQHGDFVTSQEAMDRIISQLMEQTATSNAPGPASQADIDALPRKKVTVEMFGDDGKADCSICMDEVLPEEEVTELPCKHWFHHQCVAAWLKEHDTCPHCRKGITKRDENAPKNASSSGNATTSGADPTATMPGAFVVAGEGSLQNPFVVPGSSPPPPANNNNTGSSAQPGQSSTNEGSNNEPSVAEQVRRSWWP